MIGRALAEQFALPPPAERNFDIFHRQLYDWNARMDLTAVPEPDALHRHYLDALQALPLLPDGARVIDVGTGAGFPGVPLLIARPSLSMTLLDARHKRVAFLRDALSRLEGIEAEIVHARAEDFARARREAYDFAVSRAVAPLPALLEWLLPLLRVGGQCVLWKGPALSKELADAERVARLLGGGVPRVRDAEVAGRPASLVLVDKTAATDARFPRKAGMALKRPL